MKKKIFLRMVYISDLPAAKEFYRILWDLINAGVDNFIKIVKWHPVSIVMYPESYRKHNS